MALSYYSNWGPLHYFDSPEVSTELLDCYNSFSPSDTSIFDPDLFFYSDDYAPPSDHLNYSLAPELLSPLEFELEPYLYPKRQKSLEDQYYSDINGDFFNGFVSNNPLPEFSPDLIFPVPEFESPALVYGSGSTVESVKKPLSAQSIAARQRRRKITEKTQELGKLIPGGQKMNTAEMFEAASKYIKYLQGQIAIFEIMEPIQKNEGPFHNERILQALVASPLIQEKLYSAEKCLIPKHFVETLATDHEAIKQNPNVLKEISQLIQTNSG